jgi:hypothetical protein
MTMESGDPNGLCSSSRAADPSGVLFDGTLHRARSGTAVTGLDGHQVDDFWAWAYANVMTNTNRGVLAEYLVAAALGVLEAPRVDWDAVDLRYRGRPIEVKSAGYLQAWRQQQLSRPIFSIAPHLPDSTITGLPQVAALHSDCYVFCLFTPTRHEDANPLDVGNWQFYPVATTRLPITQKSLGLTALTGLAAPVPFEGLRSAVDRELGLS